MADVIIIPETPQRVIIRDEAATRTVKVVAQGPQGPSGNVNPLMFEMLDEAQAAATSAQTSATIASASSDSASADAASASASASSALASEQSSLDSATSAAQSSASASASANTAIASASSASLSASSAGTSASNAQASATTATTKASEAAASATAAQSAAAGVQANAEAAASSATSAASSASSAATSASTASGSATNAAASASAASVSASNAAGSATAAANSASAANTSANNAASSSSSAQTAATQAIAAKDATLAALDTKLDVNAPSFGGNSATASKLATARQIAIGDAAKSFDGSANLSFALSEIGAAAASHTHAAADVLESIRPDIRPSLLLDFANSKRLDSRITFTRASTATYWDGKTFAKAEENLLLRSQEFDNSAWTKSAATVGANAAAAPDGSATADKLVPDTSATTHLVSSASQVVNGATYTFSVYLKAAEYGAALVGFIGGGGFSTTSAAIVDLATGSVSTGVGSLLSMSSTNAGGGYWRISVSLAASASGSGQVYVAAINGSTYADRLNAGNGSSGIYLWGAQLERRAQATDYTLTTDQPITKYQPVMQTAAANAARFDHNPVSGESLGLLIEEQRTNLLTHSQLFSNSAWMYIAFNGTALPNATTAPDGTQSAFLLRTSASSGYQAINQAYTTTAQTYSYSVYAKAGLYKRLSLQEGNSTGAFAVFDLVAGSVISSSGSVSTLIAHVGNGWYRCTLTFAATASVGRFDVAVVSDSWTSGSRSFTGDGFGGIYIWGAQLEAGATPTSYIPTTTAQATRSSDSAIMTGASFSSWYRQGEGAFLVESDCDGLSTAASSGNSIDVADGSVNNRVIVSQFVSGGVRGMNIIGSGSTQAQVTTPIASYPASQTKAAMAYRFNDFSVSVAGAAAVIDQVGTAPAVDRMSIGSRLAAGSAGQELNGRVRKIAYWPKRLSNETLQALTA